MLVTLYPKIKLWFINESNEAIFGEGLAKLLEAVEKHGSILEASSNLNMSYRYALHRISLAEKRLGFKLIKRYRGGIAGGSSELTTEGKTLLTEYEKMENEMHRFLKTHRYEFKLGDCKSG
ncbi:MAG: LysR family transcriptional regulator [Candidatus Bathyarchaeia archaeon]